MNKYIEFSLGWTFWEAA